jgi:trk system potassium uptake protein TrkH
MARGFTPHRSALTEDGISVRGFPHRQQPLQFIIGLLLLGFGGIMLVPALADAVIHNYDWVAFLSAAGVTAFVGGTLVFSFRPTNMFHISLRQAFLLTAASWTLISVFGGLPFMFSNLGIDFVDAVFESVSGVTTTGSTVIVGLDTAPPGILLWRAILQWIGGVGIIVTALAIMPYLKVGGMQLFRAESSDQSEKIHPRAASLAAEITMIYVALTLLCALALYLAGMDLFDALCHAMTALATGGYSTRDASIGAFGLPAVDWIITVFMLAGATTFMLYIRTLKGDLLALFRDGQLQWLLAVIVIVTLALAAWLAAENGRPFVESLRTVAFSVTSIITTTGFTTTDYGGWGSFAVAVFLFLTFIGGCTGSTAGGIKIFRFQVLFKMARIRLLKLTSPSRIVVATFQGREIDDETLISILAFLALWGFSCIVLTLILAFTGLDILTALSGAATALANVGPGLGPVIGPSGNFASLSDVAKLVLSAGMLLGRLEIMTFVVLMMPAFWRD